MKTIQEKAKEYADGIVPIMVQGTEIELTIDDMNEFVQKDYLAGYNEAMRWRDPKEELPEFNKNDYPNGDYKRYLIMVVEGSISTRRYVTVEWLISANRWNVEMDWVSVIGWRPIE